MTVNRASGNRQRPAAAATAIDDRADNVATVGARLPRRPIDHAADGLRRPAIGFPFAMHASQHGAEAMRFSRRFEVAIVAHSQIGVTVRVPAVASVKLEPSGHGVAVQGSQQSNGSVPISSSSNMNDQPAKNPALLFHLR